MGWRPVYRDLRIKGWQDHMCSISNVYRTVKMKGSVKAIFLDV